MAIEIDDPELEAKIDRLARLRGVTPEEAVYMAVRRQLIDDGVKSPEDIPARMPIS